MIRILFLILLVSNSAQATTYNETFDTRSLLDTTASPTAVWNQFTGKLHPTLRALNFKPGYIPKDLDIGDGSHGSFEYNRYSVFSQNGDISNFTIRLDPQYSELKVTSFTLDAGWTLEPVGASPLIIRSLSNVTIKGDILCSGRNGSANSFGIGGAGGTARCGGKDGGKGGNSGGTSGDPGGTAGAATGGGGGVYTGGTSIGGGGGGGWNTSSAVGIGSSSGGAAGTANKDPDFFTSSSGGGSGGGGGAGSGTAGGGGGGAGGGAVIVNAAKNFVLGDAGAPTTGFIYANGGAGGTSGGNAGGGGGGAGGSVLILAGGSIDIYNTTAAGAAQAKQGAGGSNANSVATGSGGRGRIWMSSSSTATYNANGGTGNYDPTEEPPLDPAASTVEYTTTAQSATSIAIDLQATQVTFNSATTIPVSNDFAITFAGSNDNFLSDNTGFVSDASLLTNKRYIKFRAQITSSSSTNPSMIDQIMLNYTPLNKEKFDFKAASCGVLADLATRKGPRPPGPMDAAPLLLPLLALLFLRRRLI